MKLNACKTRRLVAWLLMGVWLAGSVGALAYANSLPGFAGLTVYPFGVTIALGQSIWMTVWAIIAEEPRRMRIAGAVAGLSLAGFLLWSIGISFAAAIASSSVVGLAPACWMRARGWRLICVGGRVSAPVQNLLQVRLVDLFAITTLLAIWLGLGGFFARSELFDYVVFTGFLGAPVAMAVPMAFGRRWLAAALTSTAAGAALFIAAAYLEWIDLEIFEDTLGVYLLLGLIELVAVAAVALVLRGCGYRWQLRPREAPAANP